tara:strand:+ start:988 stop:1242 length:255 start_codon:yes stop_codon:yes gene_type:complete
MKKLLLILLCLPFIGFGQDVRGFSKCDIIVNQVLENTVSFIKDINTPKKEFRFYNNNAKHTIDWNDVGLLKWQIIDKKEIKTID